MSGPKKPRRLQAAGAELNALRNNAGIQSTEGICGTAVFNKALSRPDFFVLNVINK